MVPYYPLKPWPNHEVNYYPGIMKGPIIRKRYALGLVGLLLLVTFGFHWIFFPQKVSVYPNRPLLWRDFKQVKLISGRESINAICISTTDFEVNRIFDEGNY